MRFEMFGFGKKKEEEKENVEEMAQEENVEEVTENKEDYDIPEEDLEKKE